MLRQFLVAGIVTDTLWIADQSIKYFFVTHPSTFWGVFDFLSFHLVINSGIAFGIALPRWLVIITTGGILVVVGVLLGKAYRQRQVLPLWGLMLIVGGGISNLIDRVFRGEVVDYIDLKFFTVFNLADILISAGVVVLLVFLLRGSSHAGQINSSTLHSV